LVFFKRVGIATLVIAPVLALAVPVEAASPAVALGASAAVASVPAVNVSGTPAVYKPVKITATPHWNGVATCTTSLESFTVANNTASTQIITNAGKTLGSLPSHTKAGICINTSEAGKTEHLGLSSNQKAKLAVKVS
jgi:hypothetical protein